MTTPRGWKDESIAKRKRRFCHVNKVGKRMSHTPDTLVGSKHRRSWITTNRRKKFEDNRGVDLDRDQPHRRIRKNARWILLQHP